MTPDEIQAERRAQQKYTILMLLACGTSSAVVVGLIIWLVG